MKGNGIDCEGIVRPHVCVAQGPPVAFIRHTVLYILPVVNFGNMSFGDVALSSCADRADSPPGSFSAWKQTVWLRQSVQVLSM